MLGLPKELYTPIFAVSRIAGWSAHRLEELINKGEIDKAQALQKEITCLITETKKAASLYAAAKGVLRLRGIECGSVREPFLPLRPTDDEIIRSLYEKIKETEARFA